MTPQSLLRRRAWRAFPHFPSPLLFFCTLADDLRSLLILVQKTSGSYHFPTGFVWFQKILTSLPRTSIRSLSTAAAALANAIGSFEAKRPVTVLSETAGSTTIRTSL